MLTLRESEKGSICALERSGSEILVNRKFFSICTEVPLGSMQTSLISVEENVQQVKLELQYYSS